MHSAGRPLRWIARELTRRGVPTKNGGTGWSHTTIATILNRELPMKRRAKTRAGGKHTLSYQLREIIEARGLSAYAVGQMADVDPGMVQRFLTGRRDIRLETADRLAEALGLRLVELARSGRGRSARPATPATEAAGPLRNSDGTESEADAPTTENSG